MAHWVLRGQMAEHRDDGRTKQEKGYDEAARGGPGMPSTSVGTNPDQHPDGEDRFDREAREAAHDVRRRESSAE